MRNRDFTKAYNFDDLDFNAPPELSDSDYAILGECVLHLWTGVDLETLIDETWSCASPEVLERTKYLVGKYGDYLQLFADECAETAMKMAMKKEFNVPEWQNEAFGYG